MGTVERGRVEACGRAQSKKTQKFVLRSALRPNQISFSHSLDPEQKSARLVGSAVPADHREREVPSVADADNHQQQKSSRQRVQPKFFFKIDRHSGRE
jgi:hypothetical protein